MVSVVGVEAFLRPFAGCLGDGGDELLRIGCQIITGYQVVEAVQDDEKDLGYYRMVKAL